MGKRRKSRELALQALYQGEITRENVKDILTRLQGHFLPEKERDRFAEVIVQGIADHRQEIDSLIMEYSAHWRLERMSVIDRNILRMAAFELLYCEDIPPKVTLNEAIDLGKRFGSEDSGSFINGILDQIQKNAVRKPDAQNKH